MNTDTRLTKDRARSAGIAIIRRGDTDMITSIVRHLFGDAACRALSAATALALCALVFSGCDGSSPAARGFPGDTSPPAQTANLQIRVLNAVRAPVQGAAVTVDVGGSQHQATTPASGIAQFDDLPTGWTTLTIEADGFETESTSLELARGSQTWDFYLSAIGAWAAGRAIVLGTEMIDRSAEGRSMTFSVDVAVIAGEHPQPLETLTEAEFRIYTVDCGWGGPRDCASDAAGNATGAGGNFQTNGLPQSFGLQPAPGRRSYLAGVLAERSGSGSEWNVKGPALKSFFTTLGAGDAVGLASVQMENGAATLAIHGPFSSDGSTHFDAIDRLGEPAGDQPPMQTSVLDSIRWAAAARDSEFPGRDATLLVLSKSEFSLEEMYEVAALARQSGVRVSTVDGWSWTLPEIAVRTGGFVLQVDEARQFGMAFGVMDPLLAGALPFYRMQFQLSGIQGTFVPGGNVKVRMEIDVPAAVVHRALNVEFDVAIP